MTIHHQLKAAMQAVNSSMLVARQRVREANLAYVRESRIRSVEANVVYAIAAK